MRSIAATRDFSRRVPAGAWCDANPRRKPLDSIDAQYRQEPESGTTAIAKARGALMPAGTVGYATPEQHALVDTFNVVLWALVLSLVCANLAGLLLARGSQRGRRSPFVFRWAAAVCAW